MICKRSVQLNRGLDVSPEDASQGTVHLGWGRALRVHLDLGERV